MDYEEALLQVTDVLKANNRYRLGDFEQAVKLIREIVTPKGKWIDYLDEGFVECPFCESATTCEYDKDELHYCYFCGAELT